MTKLPGLAVLLVATLVGGCGSGSAAHRSDTSSGVLPPNLITGSDIGATRPGSPDNAALQWFQAIQFQDVAAVRRLTSATALQGISDATLDSWLSVFGPVVVRPKITSVLTNSGTTVVRMLLLDYKPGSVRPVSAQPSTLTLTRQGSAWLVNDIALLRTYANASHLVDPNVISHADVAATPPGSPSYVTLQWFQAVQFEDVVSLRRLTTAAALHGVPQAQLTSWLSAVGSAVGRPRILRVLNTRGSSLVRVLLPSRGTTSAAPSPFRRLTLQLTRSRGSWLVSDIGLLRSLTNSPRTG